MFLKIKLFILLLSILGNLGLSSGKVLTLPTCDIRVNIPDGWVYLTQDASVLKEKASQFGMTPEFAAGFLRSNGYQICLYDPNEKAQLYLAVLDSPFAKHLGDISDMTDEQRQTLYDMLHLNFTDWVNDSGMGVYNARELSFLTTTMHRGEGAERTDDRQMFTHWKDKMVILDLYVSGTGMTETLVKVENAFADSMVFDISEKKEAGRKQVSSVFAVLSLLYAGTIAIGLSMTVYLRIRKFA